MHEIQRDQGTKPCSGGKQCQTQEQYCIHIQQIRTKGKVGVKRECGLLLFVAMQCGEKRAGGIGSQDFLTSNESKKNKVNTMLSRTIPGTEQLSPANPGGQEQRPS